MPILALGFVLLLIAASSASAAGPPAIHATWASQVSSGSARLSAEIDPNGISTSYRFEYTTEAAYQADLAIAGHDGFTGAARLPATGNFALGLSALTVSKSPAGLTAATAYRYRVVATNSAGTATGSNPPHTLTTQATATADACPNAAVREQQFSSYLGACRAYEMVSPVQKNGGQVEAPGAIAGGGVQQAAATGGAVTYGSTASFAGGAGAFGASQYLARRNGGGWSTENITPAISYHPTDQGVPYQVFSPDLSTGLLFNGDHCQGGGCAVANPPIAGSGAPEGFQDYYLRNDTTGAYKALLGTADLTDLDLGPDEFDLRFVGASEDLARVVISSCAALAPGAGEVAQGSGCDPSKPNLYVWGSAGLRLINGPTPGAALAASAGAISADGARVYWNDTTSGALHLNEGGTDKLLSAASAIFQTASGDGATAFYTKGGHLYRYSASGAGSSTDLTPGGGVAGVLGASASGDYVYYQDAGGLQLSHNGTPTQVAPNQAAPPANAAEASNFGPAAGSARVSADGTKLLFSSAASLTAYDNTDLNTGEADAELYLYDATAPSLTCVSCNPTNERPIGPAGISGAVPNGTALASTVTYKPRALSADGQRVFFDSHDSLAAADTNIDHLSGEGITDAYEWQAQGEGGCGRAGGCVSLISTGRSPEGATFIDASTDGTDAFFITGESLVAGDPGSQDLYDARTGGGFLLPSPPIPCEGDACQVLPPEPVDPTLTTTLAGHGNPPVHYYKLNHLKHTKKQHKKKHPKSHGKGGRAR